MGCVCPRTLWISPTNSFMRLEFLLLLQSPQVFSVRGFEALFPFTGTLGCEVCLAPQLFFLVYLHSNVGLPSPQSTSLPALVLQPQPCCESSIWLPVSAPPTHLGECFFFISLVVGLKYSSIFCQFLLFLFLNLLLSFLLYEEAQCVYLCLHLGWKSSKRLLM